MNRPAMFSHLVKEVGKAFLLMIFLECGLGWAEDNPAEKQDVETRLQRLEKLIQEIQENQVRMHQLAEKLLGGSQNIAQMTKPAVIKKRTLPSLREVTGDFCGHRYRFVPTLKTWSEADAYARKEGGYLVVIGDQKEQEYLESMLRNVTHGDIPLTWIGLRRDEQGKWRWVDGEESSFFFWREGEPNHAGEVQNRVHLGFAGGGKWNDKEESVLMYSIIEFADSKP